MHPQTVIEHFGSWNAAKRAAGLMPRRFATREELLEQLRRLGDELGRTPTARDLDERRGTHARRSRCTGTRSGRSRARCARPGSTSRSGRSGSSGRSSRAPRSPGGSGGCRSSATGPTARRADAAMLTEWQVYRMFDSRRGAWGTFQFLVRERLLDGRRDGRQPTASAGRSASSARRRSRRAGEAELALLRSAHRRQRVVLDVLDVRAEPLRADDSPSLSDEQRPFAHLVLAQLQPAVALDDLERVLASRRRTTLSRPSPIQSGRPAPRARKTHAAARARRARRSPSSRGAARAPARRSANARRSRRSPRSRPSCAARRARSRGRRGARRRSR